MASYGIFNDYNELFYIGDANPLYFNQRLAEHTSLTAYNNIQKFLFVVDAAMRHTRPVIKLLHNPDYYYNHHLNYNTSSTPPQPPLPYPYKGTPCNTLYAHAFIRRYYSVLPVKTLPFIADLPPDKWLKVLISTSQLKPAISALPTTVAKVIMNLHDSPL